MSRVLAVKLKKRLVDGETNEKKPIKRLFYRR